MSNTSGRIAHTIRRPNSVQRCHHWRALLLLPLALAACGPFGPPTPTPLPAVTYPHTVISVSPVAMVVDRVAGAWQFKIECREEGSFNEARVTVQGPRWESSYRSDLQATRTCPSDEPLALTGGIPIDGMRTNERLTITLTVSGQIGRIVGERTYIADGQGNLRPATP